MTEYALINSYFPAAADLSCRPFLYHFIFTANFSAVLFPKNLLFAFSRKVDF